MFISAFCGLYCTSLVQRSTTTTYSESAFATQRRQLLRSNESEHERREIIITVMNVIIRTMGRPVLTQAVARSNGDE